MPRSKYLTQDGERRTIVSRRRMHLEVQVVAERVDSETPLVHLYTGNTLVASLTDVGTQDLIDRLQRALSILPTSK